MVEDMDILSNVFGHNNHIDICLSIFLPLFNVFCNVLHVLDVSWPSGYWRTLFGNLSGGFSTYPTDNAQFFACFDEFHVPHFHQGHLLEVYELST